MKEHGHRHCVFSINSSLPMYLSLWKMSLKIKWENIIQEYQRINYLNSISWDKLWHGGSFTLNIVHGGWQPTLVLILVSTHLPKLYSGLGLQGLCSWFRSSFLIPLKDNISTQLGTWYMFSILPLDNKWHALYSVSMWVLPVELFLGSMIEIVILDP